MKVRINPVYKKELKISVRSVRLSLIIFGYNALLALIGLLSFYFSFDATGYRNVNYSNMLLVYVMIAILEFAMILFVVPAFTANAIAGEREKQTLEILLTTTLKPEQIVVGKLLSSLSTIILLVFSSAPIMSIVFAVGGIRFWDLVQFMLFACVTAVFIGSIGVLFSSLFKKTVPATVFTYGAVVALIAGTFAFLMIVYFLMLQHYESVYYASGAVGTYSAPELGGLTYLLLINPAVTMFSLISRQYGSMDTLRDFFRGLGGIDGAIINYWYYISVAVQLVLSGVCLKLAAWKLKAK